MVTVNQAESPEMSKISDRVDRVVNLDEFRDTGGPDPIASWGLTPPSERQYILRMVIRAEGGEVHLPDELRWVRPVLAFANGRQQMLGINHPFVYVTVRHGLVESQTDDEWHVDGFSTRVPHTPEQNYIWCSEVGTEYVPLKVEFPSDFDPNRHNVNTFLARHVDPTQVRSIPARKIVCLDPYILHRRPASTARSTRTFVRVSFVPIEINDVNNTPNPLLPRTCTRDGVAFRNTLVDYPET